MTPTNHSMMSVEWEALPLPADLVLRRHIPSVGTMLKRALGGIDSVLPEAPHAAPVWLDTIPTAFETLQASEPDFETTISGLDVRELHEPDLFRHFFRSP